MQVEWADGLGKSLYRRANPQKVYDEICKIGERATPQQIVDRARDETSELHKCFEWDDTAAAESWRKQQARQLRHFLVIKKPVDRPNAPKIRALHFTGAQAGYVTAQRTFTVTREYEGLLSKAKAELCAFAKKYSVLKDELGEILELIAQL